MQHQSIARPFKKIGRQLGYSLLEVMGALAVGALIMVGATDQTNRYIDNTKDVYTAEHARLYAAAARAYVKANSMSISSPDPVIVNASTIVEYLPVGLRLEPKNPYRQTPNILLRKGVSGVEGYLIYDGGDVIPAGRRQFVSVMAGIGGGFVDATDMPQGSGWSDSDYHANPTVGSMLSFGQVLSATVGRVVVSLNLLSPDDKQGCDFLAVNTPANGCGEYLNRSLDMGVYGIRVTSLASVQNIIADNTISIIGAARFTDTVNITSSVTIGGALSVATTVSAEAFSPGLLAGLASSCVGYRLGTIAQLRAATRDVQGTLLSCQPQPSSDGQATQTWRPLVAANQVRSALIGCWGGNEYCNKDPVATCSALKPNAIPSPDVRLLDVIPGLPGYSICGSTSDGANIHTLSSTSNVWATTIGQMTYCAIGFRAQTQSASETLSSGSLEDTFCHVYSSNESAPPTWYLKVGSANKTPIACYAVCLKGL